MIGAGSRQQIRLETCDCASNKEEVGHPSVAQYHKNKRFSIIVEEELLRSVGEMMDSSDFH